MESSPTIEEYTAEQEVALKALYQRAFNDNVDNDDKAKIDYLEVVLGTRYSFYGFGGSVTDEMRVASLEEEYLIRKGLLDPESI